MTTSIQDRFQTLHEIIHAARLNLSQNLWDYVVGATATETTMKRNRLALDRIGFRPRVLMDVSSIDATAALFGKPIRLPVALAPVGGLIRWAWAAAPRWRGARGLRVCRSLSAQ